MVVKLKMRMIYKSLLSIIFTLLLVVCILFILYYIYDNNIKNTSLVDTDGYLSINYDNGKSFNTKDKISLPFNIASSSDIDIYFNVNITNLNNNSKVVLKDKDGKILYEDKVKPGNVILLENVKISKDEVKYYELYIENLEKDYELKGKLDIVKEYSKVDKFASIIRKNNNVKNNSITKVGSEIATSNEGLIKSDDDYGTTYYFRGNVNNNYVEFAGFTWRIVRINGDDTVKLILDSKYESLSSIYKENTDDINDSEIIKNLNIFYDDNLKNYSNYIHKSNYCFDNNENNNVNSRIITNKIPNFTCLGENVESNIGLLTIDEVIFAGGLYNKENTSFYLYNESLEGEFLLFSLSDNNNVFTIKSDGYINNNTNYNLFRNVRPVINLISLVTVDGDGTIANPYKIVE